MTDSIPMPHDIISQQNTFAANEPGLTHPMQSSHVRLRDNGDIEIVAGDTISMVMSLSSRTITFTADAVKFLTKDQQGLRWNNLAFNPKASTFSQPTFLALTDDHIVDLYQGASAYVATSKNPAATNAWLGNT
jgi:hypothetical protein